MSLETSIHTKLNGSTTNVSSHLQGLEIVGLFLGWQDSTSSLWLPVAKMTWASDLSQYCLRYTKGMEQAIEISPIEKSSFIHHPDRLYQSHLSENESLKFKSRMPLSRIRDVSLQQEWLGLPPNPIDPIAYVSRSGGIRYQDSYDVFPEVKSDSVGNYHFHFSPLGIDKLEPCAYQHLLQLTPGSYLNFTNGQLHSKQFNLGKLPGYLAQMVQDFPNAVQIEVAKVNPIAPQFHSLLCHVTVKGELLTPFTAPEYQPCVDT